MDSIQNLTLDQLIIFGFLIGLVIFGFSQSKNNKTAQDYFLGGRNLPWITVLFSIVATETSVLTFISVPGISYRGDWSFLQLGIGYILGRILVSIFLLPLYFQNGVNSIYEVIGEKFGKPVQKIASTVFLITRVLADGIRFLATAVIIQVVMGWSIPQAVLVIGVCTLFYSLSGGLKTIIWVDAFQFVIYLSGAVIAVLTIVTMDLFPTMINGVELKEKMSLFVFSGNPFTHSLHFVSALIGGAMFSLASHGTDYMMVQRVLACRDLPSAKKAMVGSGVFVTFQFALFMFAGTLIYSYYGGLEIEKDREFSTFIMETLSPGLRGVLFAGVLSAAMSTLSSSMNSLASSTLFDWSSNKSPSIKSLRLISLFWAVVLMSVALVFDEGDTAIVIIGLKIASYSYGGLLTLFVLTKLKTNLNSMSVISGLCISILTVFVLDHFSIAWTWFTLISSIVGICSAIIFQKLFIK